MSQDVMLRVQTELLVQSAGNIQSHIRRLERSFQEMSNIITGTQRYWIGDAGEAHRNVFLQQQEKREEAIRRLMEQVTDLQKMAGVYVQAEQEAQETAASLPGDVIV